jgi:hypothetical protein
MCVNDCKQVEFKGMYAAEMFVSAFKSEILHQLLWNIHQRGGSFVEFPFPARLVMSNQTT